MRGLLPSCLLVAALASADVIDETVAAQVSAAMTVNENAAVGGPIPEDAVSRKQYLEPEMLEEDEIDRFRDLATFKCKKYYFKSREHFTYEEAKEYCEHFDGRLVIPMNSRQNREAYFTSHKRPCKNFDNGCWLGAKKEDHEWFAWNGNELHYFNWGPGEPHEDENCLGYPDNWGCRHPHAAKWSSLDCLDEYHALCYSWAPPYCKPNEHVGIHRCNFIRRKCNDYGVYLKWIDQGCDGDEVDHSFNGCFCEAECAYTCEESCRHDFFCTWNEDEQRCFNKDTHEPGEHYQTCPTQCHF